MIGKGLRLRRLENSLFFVRRAPSPPSIYHLTGSLLGKNMSTSIHFISYLLLIRSPRHLYYLILGIDACFRFKRRQVSSYQKDPELGPGYAYLVAWDSYSNYLLGFTDQEEVCFYCSQRIALTDTRLTDEYLQWTLRSRSREH